MLVAFAGTEEAHTGNIAAYIFGEGGNKVTGYFTDGEHEFLMPTPGPGQNECLTSPSTYLVIDAPYKVYDADSHGEPLAAISTVGALFTAIEYKGPDPKPATQEHGAYTPDPYLKAINAKGYWANPETYLVSYLNNVNDTMTNFFNTQLSEVNTNITINIPVYQTLRSIEY
jgi:hypothetical protein